MVGYCRVGYDCPEEALERAGRWGVCGQVGGGVEVRRGNGMKLLTYERYCSQIAESQGREDVGDELGGDEIQGGHSGRRDRNIDMHDVLIYSA